MVRPLDLDLFNEVAEAENAASWKATQLEKQMVLIGRLALDGCSDLQGRLADAQHKRAFNVLRRIAEMANDAIENAGSPSP